MKRMKNGYPAEKIVFRDVIQHREILLSEPYPVLRANNGNLLRETTTFSISDTGWSISVFTKRLKVVGDRAFYASGKMWDLAYRKSNGKYKWWGSDGWLETNTLIFIFKSLKYDWVVDLLSNQETEWIKYFVRKKTMLDLFIKNRISKKNFWNSYTKLLGLNPKVMPSATMEKFCRILFTERAIINHASIHDVVAWTVNPIAYVNKLGEFASIHNTLCTSTGPCDGTRRAEFEQELNFFNDTFDMCVKLGFKFNANWSPRRIREEHDNLVLLENKGAIESKNSFPIYNVEKERDVVEAARSVGFFSALVVDNERDSFIYANQYKNCSYGYWGRITKGEYMIMLLEFNKEQVMLGVRKPDKHSAPVFNQCYRHCNQRCSDEINELVRKFIDEKSFVINELMSDPFIPASKEVPADNDVLPW